MIIERLKDAEFDALLTVQDGFRPNPDNSIVVVARQDAEIVGRLMLLPVAHVEGAWVDDRFRNGALLERMTRELEKHAKGMGLHTIFAYSDTEFMDDYIERLGYQRTPLRVFRKDF